MLQRERQAFNLHGKNRHYNVPFTGPQKAVTTLENTSGQTRPSYQKQTITSRNASLSKDENSVLDRYGLTTLDFAKAQSSLLSAACIYGGIAVSIAFTNNDSSEIVANGNDVNNLITNANLMTY